MNAPPIFGQQQYTPNPVAQLTGPAPPPNVLLDVMRGLSQGYVPNNQQLVMLLENSKIAISNSATKGGYSPTEQRLVHDNYQLVAALQSFLVEKNSDDLLQRMLENVRQAGMQAAQQAQQVPITDVFRPGVISNATTRLLSTLWRLAMLVITSKEFRSYTWQLIAVIQELTGRAMTGHAGELEECGVADFAAGVLADDSVAMTPEQRAALRLRFRNVLKGLAQNPQFVDALQDIWELVDEIKIELITAQAVGRQTSVFASSAVIADLLDVARRFAGTDNINKLLADVTTLSNEIASDVEMRTFFAEARDFARLTLADPTLLDNELHLQRLDWLIDRGLVLLGAWARRGLLNQFFDDIGNALMAAYRDEPSRKLLSAVYTILKDSILTPDGRIDPRLLLTSFNVGRSLLVPILLQQAGQVPLPSISGAGAGMTYAVWNMVLEGISVFPEHIDIKMKQEATLQVINRPVNGVTYADDNRAAAYIQITLRDIKPVLRNVNFAFSKLTFPRISDRGVADVFVEGAGVAATARLLVFFADGRLRFAMSYVRCAVDRIVMQVHQAMYRAVINTVSGLVNKRLARIVEDAVEKQLAIAVNAMCWQLNQMYDTIYELPAKRAQIVQEMHALRLAQTARDVRQEQMQQRASTRQRKRLEAEMLKGRQPQQLPFQQQQGAWFGQPQAAGWVPAQAQMQPQPTIWQPATAAGAVYAQPQPQPIYAQQPQPIYAQQAQPLYAAAPLMAGPQPLQPQPQQLAPQPQYQRGPDGRVYVCQTQEQVQQLPQQLPQQVQMQPAAQQAPFVETRLVGEAAEPTRVGRGVPGGTEAPLTMPREEFISESTEEVSGGAGSTAGGGPGGPTVLTGSNIGPTATSDTALQARSQ